MLVTCPAFVLVLTAFFLFFLFLPSLPADDIIIIIITSIIIDTIFNLSQLCSVKRKLTTRTSSLQDARLTDNNNLPNITTQQQQTTDKI